MGSELEKLKKIQGESQSIGFFLDSLNAHDIILCRRHEHDEGCKDNEGENYCGYHENEYVPIMDTIQDLLAKYFNIDLKKVEEEKHKILEDLRNSESTHKIEGSK